MAARRWGVDSLGAAVAMGVTLSVGGGGGGGRRGGEVHALRDRYDIVAVLVLVAALLIGGLAFDSWGWGFAVGAAGGNIIAYILRRLAGIPDRSVIGDVKRDWGRWLARRNARRRGIG